MLINYQLANGETTQIEVTDEVGEFYLADISAEVNIDRRETRRHNSLSQFFIAEDARFAAGTDVERNVTESDVVRRALAALTERQRYLLAAVYLDGLNFAEIGRLEGKHRSTIYDEVRAAKRAFTKQFDARQ